MKRRRHTFLTTATFLLLIHPTTSSENSILELFYEKTSGSSWTNAKNWLQTTDICTWYGITCRNPDLGGGVERIELVNNNLDGTVPPEIYSLGHLRSLNLGSNPKLSLNFTSGETSKLEHLKMDGTDLRSLKGISAFKKTLTSLHLSDNNFGGNGGGIPDEMYELTSLKQLILSGSDVGGMISSNIQDLKHLEELDLSRNILRGSIPTEMGMLTSLTELNLSENSFEGDIPTEFGNLVNLDALFLNHQTAGLTGPLLDFAKLRTLSEINLSQNNLEGSIPSSFLSGSTITSREVIIDLSYNYLTGTVPSALSKFSQLDLYLIFNKFTAIDQTLCTQNLWMDNLVQSYGCDAILCPLNTYNEYGRQVDASSPCLDCHNSATEHLGAVECFSVEHFDLEILKVLYRNTGGVTWIRKDNWLAEGVSFCDWYGVECKNDEIVEIDLSNNNLMGTFNSQDVFEGLDRLKTLHLSGNPNLEFSFDSIGSSTQLESLGLNNIDISSLEGVGNAKNLVSLRLSNNNFRLNSLPQEIYTLTNLQHFFMNNANISGRLLDDISSLSNLQTLDLSSNELSGSIPKGFNSLTQLINVTLSSNHFSGSIANLFQNCITLSYLELNNQSGKRGGFSGVLPSFATQPNLTHVNLQFNSFSGTVPTDFLLEASKRRSSSEYLEVNLGQNQLTGTIPSNFSRFEKLNLYVTENEIQGISPELCQKAQWMDGIVNQFGCNAILCPVGTYNELGRQVDANIPCQACEEGQTTLHLGSVACEGKPTVNEKEILKSLYESTNGDEWKRKDQWLDGEDVCTWYGISCSNGYVTSIDLLNNNLFGTPSKDIFQLKFLEKLDLSLNSLVWLDFTGVEQAKKLEDLNLHGTGLSSLKGIEKASTSLKKLRLGRNDFYGGSIPSQIYQLVNLEELYLFESNITGELDHDGISNLVHLHGLYAYGNRLSGSIPSTIGSLRNLTYLALAQNDFSGSLPSEFNQLQHLKALSIADQISNGGDGIIGQLLDFSNSNLDLTEIFLSDNHLSGTIPSTLLQNSSPSRIYSIDLSNNDLIGTVPGSLARFDKLNIDLADNQITALDPTLCTKSDWMDGNVEEFGCEAILCPSGTSNPKGRQEIATETCEPCTSSEHFGTTKCGIEPSKVSEREILELFYNECGGENWMERDNWLNPNVEVCEWYGVNCDENGYVVGIALGGNHLTGTPPRQLFELTNLYKLSLYSNPIGFHFDGIGNARKLHTLALDSTGLNSLEKIGQAQSLRHLNLRFNRLQGSLPDEFFQLTKLEKLTLSDNYLSGTLPTTFGLLKNLEGLLLGSNKFIGSLYDFAENSQLTYLDLSNNLLMGTIPSTLLAGTDPNSKIFIDLSTNAIKGTLPVEFQRFTDLSIHLKNNLLDEIPNDLCQLESWNHDDVGTYGCDGILCPKGTYNEIGRQSTDDTPCLECAEAKYMGSVECGSSGAASGIVDRRKGRWYCLGLFLVGWFFIL